MTRWPVEGAASRPRAWWSVVPGWMRIGAVLRLRCVGLHEKRVLGVLIYREATSYVALTPCGIIRLSVETEMMLDRWQIACSMKS